MNNDKLIAEFYSFKESLDNSANDIITDLSKVMLKYASEKHLLPSLFCMAWLLSDLLKELNFDQDDAIEFFTALWEDTAANENTIN